LSDVQQAAAAAAPAPPLAPINIPPPTPFATTATPTHQEVVDIQARAIEARKKANEAHARAAELSAAATPHEKRVANAAAKDADVAAVAADGAAAQAARAETPLASQPRSIASLKFGPNKDLTLMAALTQFRTKIGDSTFSPPKVFSAEKRRTSRLKPLGPTEKDWFLNWQNLSPDTLKGGRVLTYRRKPKSRNKNGRRPTRKSTIRRNR
jgi:hypothetical protein